MNLKKRAIKILQMLLQSTEPLTIRQLGTYLNVSERTVQNDLNQLDYWLSKNDIGKLIRKPNIGIAIDRKYKDKILEKLSDLNYYIYQLAPEERKKLIVAELLRTKECMKINELAKKMFVSRNTVISDLADVKNWLKKFNLQVKYITKKGIKVIGEEKDLRRALVESITENMNLEEIVNILDYRDLQYKTIEPGIAHQLRTLVKDIDVSPEMGAKKIGMSLITLTQPVNFGHPENDPVKIVVCLCSTDSITHLKALSQLMQFLDSKDVIELLRGKNADKELLIKYINNFSEKEE